MKTNTENTAPLLAAPLLTPQEAADLLRWSESRLRVLRCQGKGPAFVKVGRSVRYRREDLEAFVELCRPTGRAGRELAEAESAPQ